MKKVNFNNLDNIQIPEAWTKNALSLPQTLEDKRKVVFFKKFSKNLALVASLVLVCALSVSLFIFTQKGDILSTHGPEQITESTALTQTEQANQNESKINPDTQKETEEESSISTESTEIATEETVNETKKPTAPPSTTRPTTSGNKEPSSDDGSPSTKPNEGESGESNGGQSPTQKPSPTEPNEEPTLPPYTPEGESNSKITVQFPSSYLSGNRNVYCKIYDMSGTQLGDSDPYSHTHRVFLELSSSGNSSTSSYITATYHIDNIGFSLPKGTYRYFFYNENEDPICNGLFDVH